MGLGYDNSAGFIFELRFGVDLFLVFWLVQALLDLIVDVFISDIITFNINKCNHIKQCL